MQYRKFGRQDFNVSALGFGCMRFPVLNGDDGQIDEKKAREMLIYAIDHGVDYIDTAYPYHKGTSETFVGQVLKDEGYRHKVKLATKLPVWLTDTYEDFDKLLTEQLNRLQTDYIDFYLLHALNKKSWTKVKDLGVLDFLDQAVKDGKIQYVGFSYHDEPENFKEIVDAYNWDFCQIQYNYLDREYQAGEDGLRYAADKDMAIIVMEPLRGGRLAVEPPEAIKRIWSATDHDWTPAEWALRWIWDHQEVTCILSGMSILEQVVENIQTVETAKENIMTPEDIQAVEKAKDTFSTLIKVNCTACQYCMPCPVGVNIPKNFEIYNHFYMFNAVDMAKKIYNVYLKEESRAETCVACGKCVEHCPQNIAIPEELEKVHTTLKK